MSIECAIDFTYTGGVDFRTVFGGIKKDFNVAIGALIGTLNEKVTSVELSIANVQILAFPVPSMSLLTSQIVNLGYSGVICGENERPENGFCYPISPCDDYDCNEQGLCKVDDAGLAYCQCFIGYEGDFCGTQTTYCEDDTCQNDGECENIIGGYVCKCVNNWTGNNCETEPVYLFPYEANYVITGECKEEGYYSALYQTQFTEQFNTPELMFISFTSIVESCDANTTNVTAVAEFSTNQDIFSRRKKRDLAEKVDNFKQL
jgi:hypothetical protein